MRNNEELDEKLLGKSKREIMIYKKKRIDGKYILRLAKTIKERKELQFYILASHQRNIFYRIYEKISQIDATNYIKYTKLINEETRLYQLWGEEIGNLNKEMENEIEKFNKKLWH